MIDKDLLETALILTQGRISEDRALLSRLNSQLSNLELKIRGATSRIEFDQLHIDRINEAFARQGNEPAVLEADKRT